MNYLLEIKAFYDYLQINPLSTGQIALWHALMAINNKCAWTEWFTVPNIVLEINTGLTRDGIAKARNRLKQYGLIDFKSNGTKATSYKLTSMSNNLQDSIQGRIQDSIQDSIQVSLQGSIQDSTTLNKQNKTKQNKIKKNNIKKFGEYENVLLDDEQYKKLQEEFPSDYESRIQRLDDYIQSSGKKYKDHLATIRNWARKEGYRKPEKIDYREIDASAMSEEEYMRLVRGG